MPDPDAMKSISDAAQQGANGGPDGMWAGVGIAMGAAGAYLARVVRGGTVAEAIREEAEKTRTTMTQVSDGTNRRLDALATAISHLQGQMDRR